MNVYFIHEFTDIMIIKENFVNFKAMCVFCEDI